MGETSISWTHMENYQGVSWNPIRGCTRKSPGCGGGTPGGGGGCYAEAIAGRFSGPGQPFEGYVDKTAAGYRWTGKVGLIPSKLAEPLSWRNPRCCFANSMSDLFHDSLSDEEIAAVVGVIATSHVHVFQTLTKRAKRMREWFEWAESGKLNPVTRCAREAVEVLRQAGIVPPSLLREMNSELIFNPKAPWPLTNWWVGVSAEDQKRWDERVPDLLKCPAAIRFVSAEPLLEAIDCRGHMMDVCQKCSTGDWRSPCSDCAVIHQVIVGAESGPNARPMSTEWAHSIREQCRAYDTPFYMKQFATPKGRKITNPAEWPSGDWPQEFPDMGSD